MGRSKEDIELWIKEVCKEKGDIYLAKVSAEQQLKDSKVGFRSYVGSWFGYGKSGNSIQEPKQESLMTEQS